MGTGLKMEIIAMPSHLPVRRSSYLNTRSPGVWVLASVGAGLIICLSWGIALGLDQLSLAGSR
jgi:hypothetical protein